MPFLFFFFAWIINDVYDTPLAKYAFFWPQFTNHTLLPHSHSQDFSTIFPQQRLLNQIPSWAGEWSTKKSGIRSIMKLFFLWKVTFSDLNLDITSLRNISWKEFPIGFVKYTLNDYFTFWCLWRNEIKIWRYVFPNETKFVFSSPQTRCASFGFRSWHDVSSLYQLFLLDISPRPPYSWSKCYSVSVLCSLFFFMPQMLGLASMTFILYLIFWYFKL